LALVWVGVDNPKFWREVTKATSTVEDFMAGDRNCSPLLSALV
jgi:hypothetical protein